MRTVIPRRWPRLRPAEPNGTTARRIAVATATRVLNDYAGAFVDEALECERPKPCDHCYQQIDKAGQVARAILLLRGASNGT